VGGGGAAAGAGSGVEVLLGAAGASTLMNTVAPSLGTIGPVAVFIVPQVLSHTNATHPCRPMQASCAQ
jgi:hypothetical protein